RRRCTELLLETWRPACTKSIAAEAAPTEAACRIERPWYPHGPVGATSVASFWWRPARNSIAAEAAPVEAACRIERPWYPYGPVGATSVASFWWRLARNSIERQWVPARTCRSDFSRELLVAACTKQHRG